MHQLDERTRQQGFRIHALVFVPALAVMAVINIATGAPYWVLWVVLGWSIGLASHWYWGVGPGSAKS